VGKGDRHRLPENGGEKNAEKIGWLKLNRFFGITKQKAPSRNSFLIKGCGL